MFYITASQIALVGVIGLLSTVNRQGNLRSFCSFSGGYGPPPMSKADGPVAPMGQNGPSGMMPPQMHNQNQYGPPPPSRFELALCWDEAFHYIQSSSLHFCSYRMPGPPPQMGGFQGHAPTSSTPGMTPPPVSTYSQGYPQPPVSRPDANQVRISCPVLSSFQWMSFIILPLMHTSPPSFLIRWLAWIYQVVHLLLPDKWVLIHFWTFSVLWFC